MAKAHWKKILGIIVRLLIVVVGLGYVGTQLTWRDTVVFPEGYVLDQSSLPQALEGRIIEKAEDRFRLLMPSGEEREIAIDQVAIGHATAQPYLMPGLVSTIRTTNPWLLALGLVVMIPAFPMQALRWWLLLRSAGVMTTFGRTFRLHMAGCFFNTFMPGLTGGDLMKAIYVVRGGKQRTPAVLSIIVDRAVGLATLVALGAVVAAVMVPWLASTSDPRTPQLLELSIKIWLILALLSAGTAAFFFRPLSRLLGISQLLKRFSPDSMIGRVGSAVSAYREKKLTLTVSTLTSFPVHICGVVAAAMAGWALGMQTSLGLLLVAVPLIILVGALPLSFMGLGVMEPVGIALLAGPDFGATPNQIVAMLLLLRIFSVIISMSGGIFVLRGNLKLHPPDVMPDEPTSA